MNKQNIMRIDKEFKKVIDRIGADLEKELGFRPSQPKLTKTVANILNKNNFIFKNGKRKSKKKEYEITVTF